MTLVIILLTLFIVLGGWVVLIGAPYVPSMRKDVEAAFITLYPLKQSDCVLDLGSGDGKVLRLAARHGARAVGYELNPFLVGLTNWLGRRDGTRAYLRDAWRAAFPNETTVVYVFADSRDAKKVVSSVQREATRLNRPLAVISYGFRLPDHQPVAKNRAHYLYTIQPLQS